ncbi:MAG: carboxypeptidase-like regulatory domain-containing protein [Prolixibacteraceae bacterium]|nr:carboxypeptidase-like regulatory domain-containing protein [Prolixibacteraceae bacterium]
MKIKHVYFLLFIVIVQHSRAAQIQLSGFVRDAQNGEVLIGANVWEKNQHAGTTTDNRGYFSLKVSTPCKLSISYISYNTVELDILSKSDSLLNIQLENENKLQEITVTASRERHFEATRFSSKQLTQIPALGGKPDVIKALQLIPGVQTQSEGMSLMMVRGGEPGQNQYLLDNVPLIYVNHLGGFLSVFNPDMINSVDFYKGNFPARQGGKLSSIVDITQREGNISKHQGSFSVGVTDLSFTFEGPLANKKFSYIVTTRKTLTDAFLGLISALADESDAMVAYGFHDINAKLNWKPDDRNSLSLNLYQGDDYLNYWTKPWKMKNDERSHFNQQWGNWLVSGRWNRVFSPRLYAENILSYSRYRNKTGQDFSHKVDGVTEKFKSLNRASVNDFSFRSAWKYAFLKNWNIEFGGQISNLIYEPNYNYLSTSSTPAIGDKFNAVESAIHIDNKINLMPGLLIQPSFRLSSFSNNGKSFVEPEPRVNISYSPNQNQSFNLNYMRVSQSSHLVFAQSELLKKEVWLPATAISQPEISNQYALSWNGQFAKGKFSVETGVYYKQMNHLVTLKEGYENMINITAVGNKIETNGTGTAYGVELMLKKNTGKWTGSLGYAWSYADRIFANINGGKRCEYDFNRPHNVTLTVNRELRKNWTMNVVWIFQSGMPYTPALGKYYVLNPETQKPAIELIYGDKNSARMQPYHRLDLGFSHTITNRRGNKAVWTYSIYNAYNRINPYSYYFDNDKWRNNYTDYTRPLKLYKIGLFSIIPSISYKVYFDYNKRSEKQPKEKKTYNWLYF